MKIYLDFVFLINFMLDLLLLMSISIECKIFSSKKRLFLSALLGSLSIFLLFLPLNNISLFLFKIVISIIMILAGFRVTNKKIFFSLIKSLYGNSIILGGIIYVLNNQFNYIKNGLGFIYDRNSIYLIIILLASPIIFYLYQKNYKKEKRKLSYLHKITIKCNNKIINTLGFLDTGNNIKDPYKGRGIVIISDDKFDINIENALLVPFKTIDSKGIIKCLEIDELIVDDKLIMKKYLLAVSSKKINIKGASCILPNMIEEDLND